MIGLIYVSLKMAANFSLDIINLLIDPFEKLLLKTCFRSPLPFSYILTLPASPAATIKSFCLINKNNKYFW